jgi:amidase
VPWADPNAVDLKKLRVAFCTDNGATLPLARTDDDTKKTVQQVAKWLEGAVASIKEDVPKDILDDLSAARSKLTSGDAWAFYKRLADKWGTKNFSPSVKERMKTLTPISSAEYVEAWEKQDEAKSRMLEWIKGYDVFICPVANKPAQPIDVDPAAAASGFGAPGSGWPYTGVFNTTGWPVVVVRCGTSSDGKNLPIGVQIVCPPWREDICLAVGAFLEKQSGGWQRPPI